MGILGLEEVWSGSWRPYVVIPKFGGGLGRTGEVWEVGSVAIPGFGGLGWVWEAVCSDSCIWPVPGGGEAASLFGASPEQRKRSMPSGVRFLEVGENVM